MKILICGGDERSVLLAGMLKDDGHEVLCFCMDKAQLPDGVRAVSSPEQARSLCADDAMVLGGQSVFRDMMPYIDRVFVTKINCCPQSDSYFENLDASADWRIASQSEALREGDIEYSFVCYERIKP